MEGFINSRDRPGCFDQVGHQATKGQLIWKVNCQAKDSSKKRTNEFVVTSMQRVFVHFLEESSVRKKTFRDYLTFSNMAGII